MILKNLMEEKQLDFSQPLMSVRRFSSTGTSLETGKKKRKDERSEPRIPPLPVYKSELKSGPVSHAGTVPFQWEKIPGRPKDETKTPSQPSKKPPFSPKLPPGRNLILKNEVAAKDSKIRSKCDENVRNENDPFEKEEKGSLNSEDSDGAYEDALDTLSTTESFFINCSTSGLSELDSPDLKALTMDLQTRDFMIRRFLSAARAMAADTSQHPIGRQNFQQDKPLESQNVVGVDKQQRQLNSYAQMVSKFYTDAAGKGGSDGDDKDDNDSLYDYSSAKLCGLLPRIYLKGSFCILSPMPGKKTKAPKSNLVRRLRNVSSNDRSSNAVNEKHKSRGQKMTDLHVQKLEFKDQTKPTNQKNGGQNLDGLFKQNPSIGCAEKDGSSNVNTFDSHRRCFREFLEIDQDSFSPMVEKTLYIDSIHKLKSPNSSSSSSDLKVMTDYGENNLDPFMRISDLNETLPVDSLLLENFNVFDSDDNTKSSKLMDERTCDLSGNGDNAYSLDDDCIQPCNPIQSSLRSSESKSNDGNKNVNLETNSKTGVEESSRCPTKEYSTFRSSDENMDLRNQILRRVSYQESSHGSRSQSSLAPPLPKSPSESWLKRTLPAVSRSSPFHLHAESTARKSTSYDPKWKGAVKTTQITNANLQFSEVVLATIPEF